jgi:23S rRNA pseudouridine2605 synthase
MAWTLTNSEVERETHLATGVRLQKVLAAAGVGSRRKCEDLIAEGRVTIDGVVVTEMGRRVDPQTAVVHVDGARINVRDDLSYLAVNKPRGMLSTMSDPHGRSTVADLVADRPERLFHVGRLDADSEGLLLLTNDGELAHRLMHPSYGVQKTYLAQVAAPIDPDLGRILLHGIELDDGPVRVDSYRVVQVSGDRAQLEVRLHEGRNHIVRRMLAAAGYPVERLVRTAIGPVTLAGLRPGEVRELTAAELSELHRLVETPRDAPS